MISSWDPRLWHAWKTVFVFFKCGGLAILCGLYSSSAGRYIHVCTWALGLGRGERDLPDATFGRPYYAIDQPFLWPRSPDRLVDRGVYSALVVFCKYFLHPGLLLQAFVVTTRGGGMCDYP